MPNMIHDKRSNLVLCLGTGNAKKRMIRIWWILSTWNLALKISIQLQLKAVFIIIVISEIEMKYVLVILVWLVRTKKES